MMNEKEMFNISLFYGIEIDTVFQYGKYIRTANFTFEELNK